MLLGNFGAGELTALLSVLEAICLIMAALWNRAGHYIFILWFLSSLLLGSRPSDHYFRSVYLFVCLSVRLCRVFLSRL